MNIVETELTPELAARLLANPHPKQRRPARSTVEAYARAIREGRWRLVADPILVDSEERMFNGGHRCAAVVAAHRAIPVMISWDADPDTFDLIDVGRKRNAYQFVNRTFATARSGAARLTLWYDRRFDRPPAGVNVAFDLHEVLEEVERREAAFDAMLPAASRTWENTGLSTTVSLAAYAIAFGFGYEQEVNLFASDIADPRDLAETDSAWLVSERFRKQHNRARRRSSLEDWIILVRALNLRLEGRPAQRLQLGEVWPRVAESEAEFNRRRLTLQRAKQRREQDAVYDKRRSA